MRVAFYTLGCKVNQYDSDAMREQFEKSGYDIADFNETADIYVVVTCTVTETADKKSRQMLSRAKRKNPEALIVAAGCYAQRQAEKLFELGIDLVIGNADRSRVVEYAEKALKERRLNSFTEDGSGESAAVCANLNTESRDIIASEVINPTAKINAVHNIKEEKAFECLKAVSFEGRSRAQLKIQEGCNNFCSYCIIPYVRGPIRSMPIEEIGKAAKNIADSGYKEIVLTGINLTSYGKDLDADVNLCNAAAEACSDARIKRVRLGSIDVPMLNGEFVYKLSQISELCPHFHISLQSGSDAVLERMRRRYTTKEYFETVQRIRSAFRDATITTDVIVGFPGETDDEFKETLDFCREVCFQKIHVFPYSRREGTEAAAMSGQVPSYIKNARASELQKLSDMLSCEGAASFIGKMGEVLIERQHEGSMTGYTRNYIQVLVENENVSPGDIINVKFTGAEQGVLSARGIKSL